MDHVWVILRNEGHPYEGDEITLEGVFRTEKLANDRKELLLDKVPEDKKRLIDYDITKEPIHEGPNLFDKKEEE